MAETQRYEPVALSSPDSPPLTPVSLTVAAPAPPPPYDLTGETAQDPEGAVTVELPPAYDVAAKLPTYEEAERLQQDYDRLVERNVILLDGGVEVSLGNDWLFLACFIIAFVFNWIGFFAAYCMTKTVAGRYGAISGFGLSVVKWILILKRAASEDMLFTQSWFWWLLVALGWLIFVRAILVYVHIKMCVKKGRRYFPRFWGLPE